MFLRVCLSDSDNRMRIWARKEKHGASRDTYRDPEHLAWLVLEGQAEAETVQLVHFAFFCPKERKN